MVERWDLSLGIGCRFQTHDGAFRNHRVTALLDAFDKRLRIVAKAKSSFKRIVLLQFTERKVVLDLFIDAINAVFNCDAFHVVVFTFLFCYLVAMREVHRLRVNARGLCEPFRFPPRELLTNCEQLRNEPNLRSIVPRDKLNTLDGNSCRERQHSEPLAQ